MTDYLPSLLYFAGFSIAMYFLTVFLLTHVLLTISLMFIPCSFMALNMCQSSAVSAFTISSMKMHGVVNIQWPFLDTFQWPKMGKFEWAITLAIPWVALS
ncbi:MAG: hypothetical protein LVQ94_05960 [Thermoplasmatales archaeon]|nr:hypothetical protein [Thermoplasmatales archaeon]